MRRRGEILYAIFRLIASLSADSCGYANGEEYIREKPDGENRHGRYVLEAEDHQLISRATVELKINSDAVSSGSERGIMLNSRCAGSRKRDQKTGVFEVDRRTVSGDEMAMVAFESQYIDKDTNSATAVDIEMQSWFFDDQLTSLSPPRNCMPPDVLLRESRHPA
ncbi:hypothetical protein Tco_0599143 [Tanacetum coccineum]